MIVRAESINVPAYRLNVQITITEAKALLKEMEGSYYKEHLTAFHKALQTKFAELINSGKVTW